MPSIKILTSLLFISILGVYSERLELVNDDELLNLIRTEKYVVVLFSKSWENGSFGGYIRFFFRSEEGLRGV